MAQVEIERRPGYVVVRIAGEIDLGTRLPSVATLDTDTAPVVVDLCKVRFFSLAGVDWLDASVTALTARGREVRIVCAAPGPVWRVLHLLCLHECWSVHHGIDDAVADLVSTHKTHQRVGATGSQAGRPHARVVTPRPPTGTRS